MLTRFLLTLVAIVASHYVHASVSPAAERTIRSAIAQANPQATVQSVHESPIPGVYAVVSDGLVLYVAEDGKHLFFQGRLFSIADRTDYAETILAPARRELIAAELEHAIVYKAPNERHRLTVFTDVECGFCQMFHAKIDDYMKAGITIRYLAFPRGGPGTEGFRKAEAIWCSEDRKAALTAAKLKQEVSAPACANDVASDFALGQRVGVRGTPALLTEDGRIIGGMLTPEQALEALKAPR